MLETIHEDDRLTVSVSEAVRLSGLSRATLYQLMSGGQVPYITVGRRRLVPVDGLRDFLLARVNRAA